MLQDANVFASHIDAMMQQTLGVAGEDIEEEEDMVAESEPSNQVDEEEEEEEEDSSAKDEL